MGDWYAKRTLGSLPADAARRWPTREALVFERRRWTHAQFSEEVDRVARALVAIGVEPGEHVALWVTNRPEFLFVLFAVTKIGAIAIPLNTRYRTLDLDYALKHSDCRTLVTIDRGGPVDFGSMLREVLGPTVALPNQRIRSENCPALERVVFVDRCTLPGGWAWDEFLAAGNQAHDDAVTARAAAVDPDGVAMIMYTSGTTGNPKGVMLGHVGIRMCTERAALFGMTFNDVQINYLPLFHLYSIGYIALHCMLTGAKQVLMETFDPDEALRLVAAEGVTMITGFDTHYRDLIEARRRSPSVAIDSLRVGCFAGGLENTSAIAAEVQKVFCPTLTAWGMTETWSGQTLSFLDDDLDKRIAGSGYPLPGVEIRVVDPSTGKDVPQGEQGEILQRSYCVMLGYYKDPEATRRALDAEGWLHTGDAGLIRPDGHLRFVGRYKDMLKVGGENVSPAEVESLLLQIPSVAQVAVVGRPDQRLNEVVAAFVVAKEGHMIDPDEIIGFCKGKTASYKIPRQVLVVDQLPMTASGKVQKEKLRAHLRGEA